MSRGLNKVLLIGRLGKDPSMVNTSSGKPITKFSIATTRSWKTSSGEPKSETEWFNIVTWGNLAKICNQYLKKGNQVYIEGRLHTEKWKSENGKINTKIEIIANEMVMLGSKSKESLNQEISKTDDFDLSAEEDEYPF